MNPNAPQTEARNTKQRAKEVFQRGKQNFFTHLAKLIFHRAFFVSVSIVLQMAVLAIPAIWLSNYFALFYLAYFVISLVAVLKILSSRYHVAYKIAWVMPVLSVPVFGGLMYLLYGGNKTSRRRRRQMAEQEKRFHASMGETGAAALAALGEQRPEAAYQSRYIAQAGGCPAHVATETRYFPLGDVMFQQMKRELEKAEKFIFLEYFIIRPGVMWDEILEILRRKAEQGVDVRVMYDDIGCIYSLPKNYDKTLRGMGIACEAFNRYRPVLDLRLNNRSHRKLMIIDGNVGFTGGINLSDEYINQWERFGHWKDTGIMLRGAAVKNLTVMFLAGCNFSTGGDESVDAFLPAPAQGEIPDDGVVQPYHDSPLDGRPIGATVYHNLITKAGRYIYITTPYLVVDDDMTTALCVAAQSGVDVRIITPHIPDKKLIFELTRAHYNILLESGVRIFEYTPGFIHAKNFVVDDQFATVGTINLDYRSLYLHFECGVWMSGSSAVTDVRDDFLATQAVSQEITLADARHFGRHRRLLHALLRAFAPLL